MYLRLLLLLIPLFSFGQEKHNIDLLDNWQNNSLMVNSTNVRYNECWGFVQNGEEYAVIGSTEGTHFFRINADDHFEEVGFIAGKYQNANVIHRDFKLYQHYIYSVCDEGASSLQIIDISTLPDSVYLAVEFPDEITRAHNLTIDTLNALLYVSLPQYSISGLQYQKRFRVYSLTDPLNPIMLWDAPSGFPYVHDCFVRNNIAYLNCGDDGLRVYDFTTPASPVYLQNLSFYQDQGYNHQGWMTPDGTRYVFGDENNSKRLKLCSVNENHEINIESYFGTNYNEGSVPHNCMLSDRFAYVAYYNEGLRIYDISGTPKEVAWYDTYPDDSEFKMNGAWGVYTELPSGRIIVSDRQYGLFLFDFNEEVFSAGEADDIIIFPNPVSSGEDLTIRFNLTDYSDLQIKIYDLLGNMIYEDLFFDYSYSVFPFYANKGVYVLKAEYLDYLGEKKVLIRKIAIH